jgi:hypothetical protein
MFLQCDSDLIFETNHTALNVVLNRLILLYLAIHSRECTILIRSQKEIHEEDGGNNSDAANDNTDKISEGTVSLFFDVPTRHQLQLR